MKRRHSSKAPRRHAAVTLSTLAALLLAAQAAAQHPNHPLGFRPELAYLSGGIDHIDPYSGTVSLTVGIGPFLLVYNSQVWTYTVDGQTGEIEAHPDPERNAGIGWKLGWGEVYHPINASNTTGRWLFVDQAGTRHVFYGRMHENDPDDGDPDVFYSRDNSYLKLTQYSGNLASRHRVPRRDDTPLREVLGQRGHHTSSVEGLEPLRLGEQSRHPVGFGVRHEPDRLDDDRSSP